MATMTNNAMYTHDCSACTYHTTILVNDEGMYYDVYTCEAHGEKALILRFGNEDHENFSVPYDSAPVELPRYKAAKLAIELLGLLSYYVRHYRTLRGANRWKARV